MLAQHCSRELFWLTCQRLITPFISQHLTRRARAKAWCKQISSCKSSTKQPNYFDHETGQRLITTPLCLLLFLLVFLKCFHLILQCRRCLQPKRLSHNLPLLVRWYLATAKNTLAVFLFSMNFLECHIHAFRNDLVFRVGFFQKMCLRIIIAVPKCVNALIFYVQGDSWFTPHATILNVF